MRFGALQVLSALDFAVGADEAVGIVGPNPAVVQLFIEDGFDYVAIGSDIAMMTGRAADFLTSLRGTVTAAAPNQPVASAY